jgi:hypothetical protein
MQNSYFDRRGLEALKVVIMMQDDKNKLEQVALGRCEILRV